MCSFESLIENVRDHKSLYDIFSVDHKDLHLRKKAWEEIGEKLEMSAERCKSEWTKLRNCFLNSIKRRRSKTCGQAAKHISPWKYSQQMEFLLPFLENRETHSTLETGPGPSNLKPNSDVLAAHLSAELQPLLDNSDLEKSFESKTEMTMKRKRTDFAGEMVELLRENASMKKERYEKNECSRHDDVELFYLSMAKIAKRLPKAHEAKLRMDVCNKVSETELAHLLDIESYAQQNTASNQSQMLSHQVFSNNRNQPVHFQPRNLSLHEEQSESSWSAFSSTQAYIYEKQRNCRPILNSHLRLTHQQPYESISEESSSNQYESLG